jgi:HD-like signal output (HDOD) protein
MTVKVLQLVNSAFFGLRRHMSSPAEAAMLLGLDTIKTLVLWIHVFSNFTCRPVRGFSIERLSEHCLRAGLLAREIARAEAQDARTQEEAMTAGLLHDIGRLVLATNRPDLYEQAHAAAVEQSIPLSQAEHALCGTTHAGMGAYLLGLWGLPFNIVEAVALHHNPQNCGSTAFSPLTAVHAANALLYEGCVEPNSPQLSSLDTNYLAAMGLVPRVEAWRALVSTMTSKAA